jgi:chemotaxis family two-component system sensor kinase Cph1
MPGETQTHTQNGVRVPVSTLAHDLLQPLRAIVVNVQRVLRSDEGQSSETKARLDAVLSAARDQEEIIASVVEYESALQYWTDEEDALLSLSVQAACLKLDAYRRLQNGRIDVAKPLPAASVPGSISRVLEKVVHNSLKFRGTDVDPVVKIEAWEKEPGFITIRVTDNGLGVDPKYRSLVFQPFSRLNAKSSYSGAGMGLAVCLRLMECIGGTIAFEDPAVPTGANVVIRFPLKEC